MDPEQDSLQAGENHEEVRHPRGVSRRTFLLALGWGSFVSSMAVAALGSVRCLVPDVLFEPASQFKADVPEACQVLMNTQGTAPGMWFEKDGSILVSLPGVPYEMKGLMEN